MALDITKPVQTRDGRKARIICTDLANSLYPIAAAFQLANSEEEMVSGFTLEGNFLQGQEGDTDLVNIPEEYTLYGISYPPAPPCAFYTTQEAAEAARVSTSASAKKYLVREIPEA